MGLIKTEDNVRVKLFFILAIFSFLGNLSAATDPRIIAFLKKLDLYYYCPSREGLKSFSCNLRITTSPVYKENLKEVGVDEKVLLALDGNVIQLSVIIGGKKNLNVVPPPKTSDPNFDAHLKQQLLDIAKDLSYVIDNLDSDVFQPVYGEKDFKKNYSIVNRPDGFELRDSFKDGGFHSEFYDWKWRLYRIIDVKNGFQLSNSDLDCSWSSKGYLLKGYTIRSQKMSMVETDRFEYGNVGKYLLPLKIVKEMQLGKFFTRGAAITFGVSNYRLKDAGP